MLELPDNFKLIKGAKNIADILGYTKEHTLSCIIPEMKKYKCVFKLSRKKSSPWVTTPFYINLFLLQKAIEQDKEK